MSRPRPLVLAAGSAIAVGVALGGPAPSVSAATFTVTTTVDGGPGSLRAAVSAASAAGEDSVINVPAGTYALTLCGSDDTNASGDLDLNTASHVTIQGPVGGGVTIRQNCVGQRVLHGLGGGALTLARLTVTGGQLSAARGRNADGAGVWASGDVHLDAVVVTGNRARAGDALDVADPAVQPGAGGRARGGGLFVTGALSATGSTIRSNSALGGAGGDTAVDSTLTGGAGGQAQGGGAWVGGAVDLSGTALTGNAATAGAGGAGEGGVVLNDSGAGTAYPGGGGGGARGGAIAQAPGATTAAVTLRGITTSSNTATAGSVGVYRTPVPQYLETPGSVVFPPAGGAEGGAIAAAGPVTVEGGEGTQDRALGGSSNAVCPDNFCGVGPASGGARGGWLRTPGAVVASGTVVTGTQAVGGNALLAIAGRAQIVFGTPAGPSSGGAIDANGDVTMARVIVQGAVARAGQGAPIELTSSMGGAVRSASTLIDTSGLFNGNQAGRGNQERTGGVGGALAARTMRVTGTQLLSNTAAYSGGGAWASGAITAIDSTFQGNLGGVVGGGARAGGTVTATDSWFEVNGLEGVFPPGRTPLATGGGIDADGAVRLTRTQVSSNRIDAQFSGGFGLQITAASGGGIRSGAGVTAVDSTVANNTLTSFEFVASEPSQLYGGGITAAGAVALSNATVSGNTLSRITIDLAQSPSTLAAGVTGTAVRLVASTLTGNLVLESAPGVEQVPAAVSGTIQANTLTTRGSVVVPAEGTRSCVTGVAAEGTSAYSTFGDGTCLITGTGIRTSAAGVALEPLSDNGGPVYTQLPAPGSTLIDAWPSCPGVPADARGVTRPQGPACDIGAVEVEVTEG